MRVQRMIAVTALMVFLLISNLSAQVTTGTISGTVRDSTGAVIPNAKVTIKHSATGASRTVRTNGAGRYSAPQLALGDYEAVVEADGFQSVVRSGITLTLGREAILDFALEVGAVSERVTVAGEAPLIQTTTAEVAGLVDERQVLELPLNGRSYSQLVTLQPGAFAFQYGSKDLSIGAGQRLVISGSRPDQNNFLLDGTDIRDQSKKTPGSASGLNLGAEAVREFSVLGSNYNAEYGAVGGGVVNIVTRSGTDSVHGSVFEFLRNDNLDARNFFDTAHPPEFKRNQFGFSAGGPIRKSKTFAFGSFEVLRDRLGLTKRGSSLTAAAREGNLPNGARLNIPASVRPFVNLYPFPNGRDFGDGTAEFIFSDNAPTNQHYVVARVDHNLNSNHSLFVRYTLDKGDTRQAEGFPQFELLSQNKYQYVTAEEKAVLRPNLLNVFRAGFNRSWSNWESKSAIQVDPSLEFVPGRGLGGIVIGGTGGIGGQNAIPIFGPRRNNPRTFGYNLWDFSDAVSYIKNDHTLKFGFNLKYNQNNQRVPATFRGEFQFDALSDFLSGRASRFQVELPGSSGDRAWRQSQYGLFLQDDYRITSKLTLNLGLRYEFVTVPTEKFGRVANIPPPFTANSDVVALKQLFVENPSLGNVAPRIGIAWDLTGNGKTAVRAGWGMYHDEIWSFDYSISGSRNPPFLVNAEARNVPFPSRVSDLPLGALRPSPQPMSPTATPTVLRYNLSIQQELPYSMAFSFAYVGSHGYHQIRTLNPNAADPVYLPDGSKFFPATAQVVNARFSTVTERMQTDGISGYNALEAVVRKQLSHSLQFQLSYTFSKNLDDLSSKFEPESTGTPANALDKSNRSLDHALSAFDSRQTMSFNFSYGLPFGRGKRWGSTWPGLLTGLLGEWQAGGILTATAGHPFTAVLNFNQSRNRDNNLPDRPSLKPGASNNPRKGNPDRWFDPTVFVLPTLGTFGNVGRNTLTGPGLNTFDFSLTKDLALRRISESAKLQFKSEFFNLLNHANFGLPVNVVLNPDGSVRGRAGVVTNTVTTARQIQFALKILF